MMLQKRMVLEPPPPFSTRTHNPAGQREMMTAPTFPNKRILNVLSSRTLWRTPR